MGDWLGDSGPGIVFIQSYLCIVDCYWSKMCGLSWIELVGYRCFFLPWITCAMDREKERRNEQESWKGWVLWLFWRDFVGKNWLSFDWVWPGNVLRVSVINLSFLFFLSNTGVWGEKFCKAVCGLEILRNLFKQFGGHVEGRDPWPKLVSCEFLFQIFYHRNWVVWRFHPVRSGWIHTTEKSVWSPVLCRGTRECHLNFLPLRGNFRRGIWPFLVCLVLFVSFHVF